jgi:hypothetical protein
MNRIIVLWLGLLVACSTHKPALKHPVSKKPSTNNNKIANLYPWLFITDTLKIYSSSAEIDNPTYPFHGKKIDSLKLALFPAYLDLSVDELRPVYACGRFKIDDERWGLITRMGGEYSSTAVKLLIYEHRKDSLYFYKELAEDFGDAGDVYRKTTWIWPKEDKLIGAFTRSDRLFYNMVDNPADTSVERSVSFTRYVMPDVTESDVEDLLLYRKFK